MILYHKPQKAEEISPARKRIWVILRFEPIQLKSAPAACLNPPVENFGFVTATILLAIRSSNYLYPAMPFFSEDANK